MNRAFSALISGNHTPGALPRLEMNCLAAILKMNCLAAILASLAFASSTLNPCLSPASSHVGGTALRVSSSLPLDPGTTERSSRQGKLPRRRRIPCGPAGSQAEHPPKYYAARDNTEVVRPESLGKVNSTREKALAQGKRYPSSFPRCVFASLFRSSAVPAFGSHRFGRALVRVHGRRWR